MACARRRTRDVSRAASANENEECFDKEQHAAVAVARYIDSTEHLAFSTTRRTRARRKRETQRRRGSAEESRGGADERGGGENEGEDGNGVLTKQEFMSILKKGKALEKLKTLA